MVTSPEDRISATVGDDWYRQLTRLEGWRTFTTPTVTPPTLPVDIDQPPDDEARLDYHTRLTVIATSTVRHVGGDGSVRALNDRVIGVAGIECEVVGWPR